MNKTITCFIPYGSENQINKTIRHLQECPTVDRIFLLPTSPVPNLSLPDKCYILPSSAPESVENTSKLLFMQILLLPLSVHRYKIWNLATWH